MTRNTDDAPDLATRCVTEVVDLHRFFEAWMGSAEPPLDFSRCERALGEGFHIVEPDGSVLNREPLLAGLLAARGARADDGDPFRIGIDEATVRMIEAPLCLVTYVERQQGLGKRTARRSSVLFRDRPDSPNGVEWLHVHETWIDPGSGPGNATDGEGG